MPIFEYTCDDCGEHFEALLFGNEEPECPACGGKNLEKKTSSFSVGTSQPTAGGCGVASGGG